MEEKIDRRNIGFVGNSYTYYNDLPKLLKSLSTSVFDLKYDSVLVGGQTFEGHSADLRVAVLLGTEQEYLVLQDNSAVPGGANSEKYQSSLRAVKDFFIPRLRESSVKTILVYSTWGHRDGCVYPHLKPAYPDFMTMYEKTTQGYQEYAQLLSAALPDRNVIICPVGRAFATVYRDCEVAGIDPRSKDSLFHRLYAPDDFHPSRLGSYLAACVFFAVLSGTSPAGRGLGLGLGVGDLASPSRTDFEAGVAAKLPELYREASEGGSWRPDPITEELALTLQQVAHRCVFE